MEETKYYQPQIEEFHVGFELELKLHELKNWEKHTWLPGDQANSVAKYLEQIRVKCLDQEDIESFGFPVAATFDNGTIHFSGVHRIIYTFSGQIVIRLYRSPLISTALFQGKIKNKSELKRLLKQLEII